MQTDKKSKKKSTKPKTELEKFLEKLDTITFDPKLQPAINELIRLEKATATFQGWCEHVLKDEGQKPAHHHEVLIEYLEKVATGEIDRLMINMPPGYAKSTYTSKLFPAYFALKNPKCSIVGASHGDRLATKFSKHVRKLISQYHRTLDYDLDPESKAADAWTTTTGVEYLAVGAGAGILGTRSDLFLIDDCYASIKDATSKTIQDNIWEWYTSDVVSRLKPGGRIVIIMTRFHENDLCGQILETEGDRWTVLKMPAICEEEPDPVGRKVGEYLWADYMTPAKVDAARKIGGEMNFAGNYQQRPAPVAGALFDVSKLVPAPFGWHTAPDGSSNIMNSTRAWDIAVTADGDWSVGVLMHRLRDGRFIISDVIRFRGDPQTVEQTILQTAGLDKQKYGRVTVRLPEDPAAAGKGYTQYLTRTLAGYIVQSQRDSGNKETRAMPIASQINAGNVLIETNNSWIDAFKHELTLFPNGKKDDQVDAMAYAFTVICDPPSQTRVINVNLLG